MPKSPKHIRINADDAGLHPSIDDGIEACIAAGSLSAISVVANAKLIDWQRIQAFAQSGIQVGVHLTWVEEPWMTEDILIGRNKLFLNALRRSFLEKVKAEGRRQIETLLDKGFSLSHIDSHQHVHHFPGILQITEELAKQYGIPYIRVASAAHNSLRRKGMGGYGLQYLCTAVDTNLQHLPCIGLQYSGSNTLAVFESELAKSDGNVELIMHPGVETAELRQKYAAWKFNWDKERALLTSAAFKLVLEQQGYVIA